MTIEATRIDRWLFETLTGDAALTAAVGSRVYSDLAPDKAAMPYVVFSMQTADRDVQGIGTERFLVQPVYLVKAVGAGVSYEPLEAIADRIDAVLQGGAGSVTGGLIHACIREQMVRYPEVDAGQQFRHLGGLYRIWAQ